MRIFWKTGRRSYCLPGAAIHLVLHITQVLPSFGLRTIFIYLRIDANLWKRCKNKNMQQTSSKCVKCGIMQHQALSWSGAHYCLESQSCPVVSAHTLRCSSTALLQIHIVLFNQWSLDLSQCMWGWLGLTDDPGWDGRDGSKSWWV